MKFYILLLVALFVIAVSAEIDSDTDVTEAKGKKGVSTKKVKAKGKKAAAKGADKVDSTGQKVTKKGKKVIVKNNKIDNIVNNKTGKIVNNKTDVIDNGKEVIDSKINVMSDKVNAIDDKVNVNDLMENFKVKFVDDTPKQQPIVNGTIISPYNNTVPIVDEKALKEQDDKKFKKLVKQVFGSGENKKKARRYSKNGRELKYYKDNGIPMMLRKVIPPRGAKLPNLHFEYVEGDSICRCTCDL